MIASAIAIFQAARKAPGTALCVIGAVLALCALSFLWGLGLGNKSAEGKVSAQQLRQAKENLATAVQANKELVSQMQRGEKAAKALRDQLDQRDKRIKDLTWRLKDVPKLIATPSCPAPGAVHLSVGAVQLYDAALSGGEGGQLSGGACRTDAGGGAAADAGSGGECARPSGITVARFQEVAQTNAERHGACFMRLEALRDFLSKRDAPMVGADNQ